MGRKARRNGTTQPEVQLPVLGRVTPPWKGKKLTEAAGEYPQELAEEVAKMIIMTWKRVLGLEYWRHKVETCAEEVSQYSKIWLEAERNRKSPPGKKRVWKVAFQNPPEETPKGEEKAEGKRVASVAFEGDDNTENVRPKSSALPSKKERKIKDDDFAIGGMRHPKKAVDRLHLVKGCGMQIRNEWELFYLQNPQAKLVAKNYGTNEAVMDEEVLTGVEKEIGEDTWCWGRREGKGHSQAGLRIQVPSEGSPVGGVAEED